MSELSSVCPGPRTEPAVGAGPSLREVVAYRLPYDYWHDRYQGYYREGVRLAVEAVGGSFREECLSRFPGALRVLRRVRNSSRLNGAGGRLGRLAGRGVDRVAGLLAGRRLPPSGLFHPLVGQYLFRLRDGREVKVCVDSQDGGELGSDPLLQWCDLYFKTNYHAGGAYPDKVRPFYNGNPLLLGKLDELRALRAAPREYDLCFIVRVWGGSNEVEGVEHNLRLLEAAARTRCTKYLLAYLVAGDIGESSRRLEQLGIPWTCKPLPLRKLWEVSARSRVNVIRLGMHRCVPWRMTDLLALGSCVVLDQAPATVWPQPLEEGTHFENLHADTSEGQLVAAPERYAEAAGRLEALARDPARAAGVGANNAAYYDRYLDPERAGEQLARSVLAWASR